MYGATTPLEDISSKPARVEVANLLIHTENLLLSDVDHYDEGLFYYSKLLLHYANTSIIIACSDDSFWK